VLGCTHYPLLKPLLGAIMGDAVRLVDSAEETAREVARELESRDLLAPRDSDGGLSAFVSDLPLRFRQVGELFLGEPIDDLRLADGKEA